MMTIELPYWAVIGTKVLVKDYARARGDNPDAWYEEEIIGFGYDGVFHKAHNCPTYYTPFNQYGISIKLSATEQLEDGLIIGDEVVRISGGREGLRGIVIDFSCNYIKVVYNDSGSIGSDWWHCTHCEKTGKHYPQMVEMLSQLKGTDKLGDYEEIKPKESEE